jgi:hypothetical protein
MMVKVITTELLQVNGFTFIITRPFQEFRKSITIGRRNLGGTGRHGRKNSVGRERQIVSRNPDLGAQSGRLSDWKKFFRLMKKINSRRRSATILPQAKPPTYRRAASQYFYLSLLPRKYAWLSLAHPLHKFWRLFRSFLNKEAHLRMRCLDLDGQPIAPQSFRSCRPNRNFYHAPQTHL